VPGILNDEVLTGWALPCVPYGGAADQGFLFIPEVEAGVWVEFEAGNLDYPVWVGTYWGKPGGTSEVPKPNKPDGSEDSAVQNPPTRKIIKTLKGHTIQFEDAEGEDLVLILEKTNGNLLVMNSDGIKVTDGANQNEILLDNKGIKLTDKTGNIIEMSDSAFTITSKVAFDIKAKGQAITITGSTIDFKKG
jgi:uncharacterized protein involved in type VI secretion and phage assembly